MSGVSGSEMISHDKEESPLLSDQHVKNSQLFTSLGRQSSIYSLTLDEFQHTLCDNGKNFGSMNMDEFLNSIWTAEENQAINSTHQNNINILNANHINSISSNNVHLTLGEIATEKKGMIAKQPSLARQGSLTLPGPLCRKTVDEVWSEIHKGQKKQAQEQQQNSNHNNSYDGVQNSEFVPRQPTFGEMTLEDFLVKAGVVREPDSMSVAPLPPQLQQQPQQYGIVGQSFVMGMGVNSGGASTSTTPVLPNYQTIPQGGPPLVESSGYATNGKRNGAPPPLAVNFGGRVVNGGGGYAPAQPIGMPTDPVSPGSSDGMCASQVENSGGQYGMDIGALRGRKRILDGPVEKVVERRQRRMIKNRESAARSRARKQAYTVELEAELNQLREENAHLKQALAELEMKRKQQYCEEMRKRVQSSKAQKAMEKLWMLKRSHSCSV